MYPTQTTYLKHTPNAVLVPNSGHWFSIWPGCRQWKHAFCLSLESFFSARRRIGINCVFSWCLGTPCLINLNFSTRSFTASSFNTLNPSNLSTFEYESCLLLRFSSDTSTAFVVDWSSPVCCGFSFISNHGVASSGIFWLDDLEPRALANLVMFLIPQNVYCILYVVYLWVNTVNGDFIICYLWYGARVSQWQLASPAGGKWQKC